MNLIGFNVIVAQLIDHDIYIIRVLIIGSRVESEVVGFFVFAHIRMMGYFWLG